MYFATLCLVYYRHTDNGELLSVCYPYRLTIKTEPSSICPTYRSTLDYFLLPAIGETFGIRCTVIRELISYII